jgi:hypothetical protein
MQAATEIQVDSATILPDAPDRPCVRSPFGSYGAMATLARPLPARRGVKSFEKNHVYTGVASLATSTLSSPWEMSFA